MGVSTVESSNDLVRENLEEEVSQKVRTLKRPGRILMKRRRSTRSSGRRGAVERRVKTLKRLVPKGDECRGLDGLFRETADYILSLQMKVKLMQIMVKALSDSEE